MRQGFVAVAAVFVLLGAIVYARRSAAPKINAPARTLEEAPAVIAPPPAPKVVAPPPVPAVKPADPVKPAPDPARISDLLDIDGRSKDYLATMSRIRELLQDRTTNAVFIADLPGLSVKQMVALWDVLWLTAEFKKDGFAAFGDLFAREITRRLAELLPTYRDAQQRHLVINMLLPDVRYLSDDELARLKAIAEADADPYVRQQAAKLKR